MATRAGLALLVFQGLFYFVLGLWPIFHIDSFQAVTGPKTDHLPTGNDNDHWLVYTVGGLIAVVGGTQLISAYLRRCHAEIIFLSLASAFVLMCIDVVFVWREVIAPIYLADAVVELALCVAWLYVAVKSRAASHQSQQQ